jgi:DNA primase
VIDDYHGCKDADELIQKDPALWQEAVQKYRPALEWLLEKYVAKYDLKTEKGFQEYATEAKRLIDQIDAEDAVLREKYERIVSERLGISLEAFRAKKVAQPEKKRLKKTTVVKNTTVESRAEKSLAALAQSGKVDLGGFEVKKFDQDELSFIFDEKYGGWGSEELAREATALIEKVESERLNEERKTLEEQIRQAEKDGNEQLEGELMQKLSKMLRRK